MKNFEEFKGFLSERGRGVYALIRKAVQDRGAWDESHALELAMLANSFDLYYTNAEYVRDNTVTMEIATERGTYYQIRPEYTAMKTEYANVLKHSAKFGLNPTDMKRIFGDLNNKKQERGSFITDMKIAAK